MRLICKIKENNRRGISNHDTTLELISPWSTAITASHRPPRFLEFSSTLELRYHQHHPQYYCLKFSPSLVPVCILVSIPVLCSNIAFLCFPSCTHRFPVFQSVFRYVPVPNGYVLWLVYRPPPCTIFDMFEYQLWLLFSLSTWLWSLLTSIRLT